LDEELIMTIIWWWWRPQEKPEGTRYNNKENIKEPKTQEWWFRNLVSHCLPTGDCVPEKYRYVKPEGNWVGVSTSSVGA
jgi:hypothetical protein